MVLVGMGLKPLEALFNKPVDHEPAPNCEAISCTPATSEAQLIGSPFELSYLSHPDSKASVAYPDLAEVHKVSFVGDAVKFWLQSARKAPRQAFSRAGLQSAKEQAQKKRNEEVQRELRWQLDELLGRNQVYGSRSPWDD